MNPVSPSWAGGVESAASEGPFWLAARKTTDSLFIAPTRRPSGSRIHRVGPLRPEGTGGILSVRAAAISATFLLVQRAALGLDIDPDEFEVLEPRRTRNLAGDEVPVLQIADELVNGAGFCERLARPIADGRPLVAEMIRSIVHDRDSYPLADFLPNDHVESCDQACYRCLQRYGNRAYHGLLDWRLGLTFLHQCLDADFSCGLDSRFDACYGLADWPTLAERYADKMRQLGSSTEIRQTNSGLWAFRLSQRHPWVLIVHPLWDVERPVGILARALDELGHQTLKVDTFELARRSWKVRRQLLEHSR